MDAYHSNAWAGELNVAWPTPDDLLLITQRNEGRRLYFAVKRLFDLSVALILLTILSPLLLFIAVIVMLDTPGPAIFKQPRVGIRRVGRGRHATWELRTFNFYKFRSMFHRADPNLHQEFTRALLTNDKATVEALLDGETQVKKMIKDPRITRVGRRLRKSSIDELPQLLNVFKGDMGLVGPRPPTIYEAEMYNFRQAHRMGAMPGMTGLWQVKGRNKTDYEEMIQLDLEYIEYQSFWLDLKILILTPIAILQTRSAG